MNEMENMISIELEDGSEMLCEILFTFTSEEFNKNYVLYMPVDDEDGSVYASSYNETDEGMGELEDIIDDAEWEMIQEVLNTFQKDE